MFEPFKIDLVAFKQDPKNYKRPRILVGVYLEPTFDWTREMIVTLHPSDAQKLLPWHSDKLTMQEVEAIIAPVSTEQDREFVRAVLGLPPN
jgi:hypothetical protein